MEMDASRASKAEENLAPSFSSMGTNDGVTGQPPSQYECPICLNWLQEPVVTSCGHRFCNSCITAWLQQSGHCPVDNVNLSVSDLFPDNFTRREILQHRLTCPFAANGCNMQLGPLELDNHVANCKFNKALLTPSPKSSKISCSFKGVGCKVYLKNEEMLSEHLESHVQTHMNLLMAAYSKLNMDKEVDNACANSKNHEAMTLWEPPDKQGSQSSGNREPQSPIEEQTLSLQALIRALYERVVILEQRNHEQDITIGNLSRLISSTTNGHRQLIKEVPLRFCFGTHIWKIENFTSKLDILLKDPAKMVYSEGFYTSPNGYKFCARLNASPVQAKHLAFHIHIMKSNNDYCLDWPFKGRITILLVNPTFPQLSQKDTMITRPDLVAFQQPTTDMSTRGFGFTTYISAEDVKFKGFVLSDCLIIQIKIQQMLIE